ncbi:hypothetical protein RND71_012116 [Anisodus tanguticus]|uniref:Uncharacterized protein n=1 Tax=Anisodus tanguticus TaxID=243964 RepID=A0AAE1SCL5_9SOLA|nr:hypothetical protein RND71_012116 [Anisodus tanguticus]
MSRQNVTSNYLKIEKEAPEEIQHRKAQFLIYKSLNKADSVVSMRKNNTWLKVKFCKLKIKIGKKLKSQRKSILLTFCVAKIGVYKQFICQLKYLKSLLGKETMVSLPPVFISS